MAGTEIIRGIPTSSRPHRQHSSETGGAFRGDARSPTVSGMGILTVEQIVSADGYAASRDGGLEFFGVTEGGTEGEADEADQDQLEFLEDVDAILLGANTYRMFADYWPTADARLEPVAVPINALPKLVFSNSLSEAPWGATAAEVVDGDPAGAVAALKDRFPHIVVWGSLQLTFGLFEAGLVDRLRLRVVPALLGFGRSFTPSSLDLTRLELDHSVPHPRGQVTLDYRVPH